MQKKIKNKHLEEILNNAAQLGNFAMPGELTFAIIETRKKIKSAFESYNEACKQIGETRCERDSNNFPVSEFQKDDQGNDLLNRPRKLKFKDAATENAALDELRKLGEQDVDIKLKEFNKATIEGLNNITPIQMEAITALVDISEK